MREGFSRCTTTRGNGHASWVWGATRCRPGSSAAGNAGGNRLTRTLSEQHHAHGFEQDEEIQKQRVVLHVIQIVLELPDRLLDRCAVRVTHLRPPRQPGLDAVAYCVERYLLGQHRHEFG